MERLTARSENGTAIYKHPVPELEGLEVNRHAVLERCCQYEELEEKLQNTFGECDGLLEELVNSFFKHATAEVKGKLSGAGKVRLLTDGEVDKWLRWKGLEKDGKLIELPCKTGDTVYVMNDDCECPGDCYQSQTCKSCEYRNLYIDEEVATLSFIIDNIDNFGKTVFLTEQEALEALEGR